jgi:hypothetical protein
MGAPYNGFISSQRTMKVLAQLSPKTHSFARGTHYKSTETSMVIGKTNMIDMSPGNDIVKVAISLTGHVAMILRVSGSANQLLRVYNRNNIKSDIKYHGVLSAIAFDEKGGLYTLNDDLDITKINLRRIVGKTVGPQIVGQIVGRINIRKIFNGRVPLIKDIVILGNNHMVIMDSSTRQCLVVLKIDFGDFENSKHVNTYTIRTRGKMVCMCVVDSAINVFDDIGKLTRYNIDPTRGLYEIQRTEPMVQMNKVSYKESSITALPLGGLMVLYDDFRGTDTIGHRRALILQDFEPKDIKNRHVLHFDNISIPFIDNSKGSPKFANVSTRDGGMYKTYMYDTNSLCEVTYK